MKDNERKFVDHVLKLFEAAIKTEKEPVEKAEEFREKIAKTTNEFGFIFKRLTFTPFAGDAKATLEDCVVQGPKGPLKVGVEYEKIHTRLQICNPVS